MPQKKHILVEYARVHDEYIAERRIIEWSICANMLVDVFTRCDCSTLHVGVDCN